MTWQEFKDSVDAQYKAQEIDPETELAWIDSGSWYPTVHVSASEKMGTREVYID